MCYATLKYNRAHKFSADAFCCWFVVMILWLSTAIGGWLIYFEFMNAGSMWLGSLVISFFSALYIASHESGNSYNSRESGDSG